MKIIICAHIEVDPELRDKALQEATPVIQATLDEPGCLHYNWAADAVNPSLILVYEEWQSAADLDLHFTTENFSNMHQILGASGLINATARKFSINQEAPVMKDGAATAEF